MIILIFIVSQVMFVNDSGLPEAGIDAGGVFKEFLSSLVERAFDLNLGLFFQLVACVTKLYFWISCVFLCLL